MAARRGGEAGGGSAGPVGAQGRAGPRGALPGGAAGGALRAADATSGRRGGGGAGRPSGPRGGRGARPGEGAGRPSTCSPRIPVAMKCVIEGGNVKGATGRRKGGGVGGCRLPPSDPPPPPSALSPRPRRARAVPCRRPPLPGALRRWGRGGVGAQGDAGTWPLPTPRCPVPPPVRPQLSLRAASTSRSAFASFLFVPLFFQRYEPGPPGTRCKVLMKVRTLPPPPSSPPYVCPSGRDGP